MNKYNARKTYCLQKHKHDSKKEADHCNSLWADLRAGKFISVDQQPRFLLQRGFTTHEGKKIRPITYIADFLITYKDGTKEVIDVKGVKTDTFKLKWKMVQYKYQEYKYKLV